MRTEVIVLHLSLDSMDGAVWRTTEDTMGGASVKVYNIARCLTVPSPRSVISASCQYYSPPLYRRYLYPCLCRRLRLPPQEDPQADLVC